VPPSPQLNQTFFVRRSGCAPCAPLLILLTSCRATVLAFSYLFEAHRSRSQALTSQSSQTTVPGTRPATISHPLCCPDLSGTTSALIPPNNNRSKRFPPPNARLSDQPSSRSECLHTITITRIGSAHIEIELQDLSLLVDSFGPVAALRPHA
jgi:hypothetical protein